MVCTFIQNASKYNYKIYSTMKSIGLGFKIFLYFECYRGWEPFGVQHRSVSISGGSGLRDLLYSPFSRRVSTYSDRAACM